MAVSSITVSGLAFPLNQQFTVNVTVENRGPLPVPSADLEISFDGEKQYSVGVTGIAPGGSAVISYSASVTDLRTGIAIAATVSVPEPLADSDPSNDSTTVTEGSP
jgi:hypothetical protein